MKKHPGFEKVAAGMAAKQGVPMKQARAMLAAGTRKAGPKAREKNPRLNRVKGSAPKPRRLVDEMLEC